MTPNRHIFFPPFHLDMVEERLRRDAQVVFLRPKTFAVLLYLAEHPAQLVTKEELLSAVWSDTYVTEGVLTVCMTELRQALGDDAKTPRFIETAHRKGYRFIAPLTIAPPVASSQYSVVSSQKLAPENWQLTTGFVGREQEMAELRTSLEDAISGRGRLMLLVGEPGDSDSR
jgi:DNA-binding winged helix-turn-helix (wHTH) protein